MGNFLAPAISWREQAKLNEMMKDDVTLKLISTPKCCMLSGEATTTHFIIFGLTPPGSRTHDLLHAR
jgi:hypothetical protein